SFAGTIRYLQVGLAGEAVDAIMVLPDHRQTAALTSGPFAVVNYARPSWLFARRAWRQVVEGVKAKIDALRHDGPVVVHALDLTVFMVGKGPAEAQWRRTADSLDMRAAVIFTGNIDNWRNALTGADIFCVPHAPAEIREEPLQALADGLAVVAANGSVYDCFQ